MSQSLKSVVYLGAAFIITSFAAGFETSRFYDQSSPAQPKSNCNQIVIETDPIQTLASEPIVPSSVLGDDQPTLEPLTKNEGLQIITGYESSPLYKLPKRPGGKLAECDAKATYLPAQNALVAPALCEFN